MTTDLCKGWTLYYAENRTVRQLKEMPVTEADVRRVIPDSVPASVPGNFELDLFRAGKIPDPFFGKHTLEMQQLENLHLWYCRSFVSDGVADAHTFLRFEGIDTVAEIWLNGVLLQKTANMFLPVEIPVPQLRKGVNDLTVHILPAVIAAREFDIPAGSNALTYNYESLYIRKAASMFGWDIMPRIVSGGLWKPVSLVCKKENRMEDLFVYTLSLDGTGADLCVYFSLHIEADFMAGFSLRVKGSCGDSVFEAETPCRHTNGRLNIHVDNARLWYPKNAGEQPLYDCAFELLDGDTVADTRAMRIGIRTVALERTSTADEEGHGDFCFVVNGKRVFCMGTNWVPLDAFHSRDAERLDRAVAMAEDLGCNIIRMWGGNVYENDRFYELCDEKGILVWQDFGMGCAVYPQDRRFLEMLEPEIVYTVKRLRNHPCLALWAGDNECDQAYGWAGIKRDPNQNIITRQLIPQLLRMHDFTRPYLPSSPYIDEVAFASGGHTSEDHLWGPRDYFKGPYYSRSVCSFASETGYHGCPSPDSLKRFLSDEALWPVFDEEGKAQPEWLVHAACMRLDGRDPYAYRISLMAEQVKTLFGTMPDNLRDFALMSQISQAEAKKYFIERFRIRRGQRNGIIWWNLLDGWPQISDAIVDYYFTRKMAYHYIRRSQAPVLLAFDEPRDGMICLYGINDTVGAVQVSGTVRNMTDGRKVASVTACLPAEKSTALIHVPVSAEEKAFLLMTWTVTDSAGNVSEGSNHYFTNLIDIDFEAYTNALRAAGMMITEGFD